MAVSLPIIFALTSAAGLAPLGQPQDGPPPCRNEKGEQVVVVHDTDKKAVIAKGEFLVVKLPARLGTGFGWQVAKHDEDQLKLEGEPTTEDMPPEEKEKLKVGGYQYQVFRFVPGKPGSAVLKLEYRRPFDTESDPLKTYKLLVDVRKLRE